MPLKLSRRLAAFFVVICLTPAAALAAIPTYGYQVVRVYPHDRTAFTEGLFYKDGFLYESAGLYGHSQIRKESLTTGQVVLTRDLPTQVFGEGFVNWGDKLYQLTWRNQIGFIYDLATFRPLGAFSYSGEGWSLTKDSRELIMSDGTPQIRFIDPKTLKELHRITVTADGAPVANLNELEWVKGQIFANVWMTNRIARIDPASGQVVGWIDLTGILPAGDVSGDRDDVLNGIAYDAKADRLFVTGKRWPKLFEIKLVKQPG